MSATKPSFVSVDSLLSRAQQFAPGTFNEQRGAFSDETSLTTGFHVYCDIHLTLSLAAAEDKQSAQKYLDTLTEYARIAEAAATTSNSRLLEIQGERLHFLVEDSLHAKAPSAQAWGRLFALSHALVTLCYERLAPLAGTDWKGCRVAADYGLAALLFSTCGGGSIVSLGNPANRPAKRLGQSPVVAAGHLAVPKELLPAETKRSTVRNWIELDMRTGPQVLREFVANDISGQMRDLVTNAARRANKLSMGNLDKQFFDAVTAGRGLAPVQVQGFCFRADLDGFTKQVEAAFAAGPDAVFALVRRFQAMLEFPLRFAANINARTIPLPWAGDCATVLLLPAYGESFTQAQDYLPVQAATKWHISFRAEKRFSDSIGAARWSLGLAAGDEDEGHSGQMLVAELSATNRQFRVAAGWAVRRSNDGYQYDGVVGGDTVLTRVDRTHLRESFATHFKDLGSDFAKATIEQLEKQSADNAARASAATSTKSSSNLYVPAPSPHA